MNKEEKSKLILVKNPKGPDLCYSQDSGVKIIEKDGLCFKDLAKDGQLHPYEDWRLSPQERAKDLASRLSVEQIAGLMLYSMHQFVPNPGVDFFGPVSYGGKPFFESGQPASALSDQQKEFMEKDFIRHVLVAVIGTSRLGAEWNNNLQQLAEKLPFGIPVTISSDPRHGADASKEYNAGAGGDISHWPEALGMAATFDPELVEKFGEIASREYRALGIGTALSPQVDLATEPRWWRFGGTFGEDVRLTTDMARAYCDGFQNSRGEQEISDGWGFESVNVMVKHWPGGGTSEGGRDAHFSFGKYNVYPGNNMKEHLIPFVDGAFQLEGKTKTAAAVMPYYSISFDQDQAYEENVGNSFSRYIIHDLLREKYGYDGVVCTDWGITRDQGSMENVGTGKCWGTEHLSEAERCLKIILAGVDQFGGLNETKPVLEAYELGVRELGEKKMRERMEESARRLLVNAFHLGLFENPYVDPDEAEKIVGNPAYMQAGYEAQQKSVVMLKNRDHVLPLQRKTRVYIPKQYTPGSVAWTGDMIPESWNLPVSEDLVNMYFELVKTPEEADAAICFMRQPGAGLSLSRGYSLQDRENGGNGYMPISLQYRPYTAVDARKTSIAGGDPLEPFTNRSYKGKTVTTENEKDLDMLLETREAMGGKPVIAVLNTTAPVVCHEFEEASDAILVSFGQVDQAVLDIASGGYEPSGLMPMQMPANMKTVEEQMEDVPFDMECHVDSEGHSYDFGFGMNWNGVIQDERTRKYGRNE